MKKTRQTSKKFSDLVKIGNDNKKAKKERQKELAKAGTKARLAANNENANQFGQNQMKMPSTSSLELGQAGTSSKMDSKKRRLNEDAPKEDEIARMRKHRRAKVDGETQTEWTERVDGATQTEWTERVDGATQTDWTEHDEAAMSVKEMSMEGQFNLMKEDMEYLRNDIAAWEKECSNLRDEIATMESTQNKSDPHDPLERIQRLNERILVLEKELAMERRRRSIEQKGTPMGQPRKSLEDITPRRCRQIGEHFAGTLRERNVSGNSPSLERVFSSARRGTNSEIEKKQLTEDEDIFTFLDANVSWKARQKIKQHLFVKQLDVFASTSAMWKRKQEMCAIGRFKLIDGALICVNILEVVAHRLNQQKKSGIFKSKDGKILLCIQGDKGGDGIAKSTKVGILPATLEAPNSHRNWTFIAGWMGDDNRKNMERFLGPAIRQIKCIEAIEIAGKAYKVEFVLCADLKFVSAWMGHQGCAAKYPCANCRVDKDDLLSMGRPRTFGIDESEFSCPMSPLLNIPIVPPPLHILHGLIGKALDIADRLADQEKLNQIYKKNNAFRDQRTKKFCGNTIKKIVESRNEIAALMPNENGIRTIWGQLLFNFRMLLRLSAAGEFNLDGLGLKRLREHCWAAFWNFQKLQNALGPNPDLAKMARATPKMHWLLHHVVPYAESRNSWGLVSEQAMEAVHAHFNRLIDRYRNTGNSMAAFEKMARHQTLWNALYDRGHGKDVDDEQIDEENDENIPPIN